MRPPARAPVKRRGLGQQSQQPRHGAAAGAVVGRHADVQVGVGGAQEGRCLDQNLRVSGGDGIGGRLSVRSSEVFTSEK